VRHSLDAIGEADADDQLAARVLAKVKDVGQMGRVVDLAELRYIVRYINEHPNRRDMDSAVAVGDQNEYEPERESRFFTLAN